jgi:ribosome-binding protein aMBF1 (putative translation factor)
MVKVTASEIIGVLHPCEMVAKRVMVSNGHMSKKSKPIKKREFRRTFIREWRQHRNLTLEQLAGRLEMTPSHLSMLERGQRGYTQETLEAIAEALQTDTGSLTMRNAQDSDAIWSIWDNAKPAERQMITDIARTIVKTGTK